MTDPNICYIWGFLKVCHERGWLYQGHRSMPWCPRCGTSLSQHELIDSYKRHRRTRRCTCACRLPAATGEYAGRVDDDALDAARERRRGGAARRRRTRGSQTGAGIAYVVAERALRGVLGSRREVRRHGARAPSSSGCAYARAVRRPARAGRASSTASSPGTRSSMDEGTGIVHIAPGCGAEDFELGRREGLRRSCRSTRPGASSTGTAGCTAAHAPTRRQHDRRATSGSAAGSSTPARSPHRYPVCWRCGTELIFRLVDEWFIRCDELREPMIDAARDGRVDAARTTASAWRTGCATWATGASRRKRYWGLPLPFYFCAGRPHDRGRLAGGAARARACAASRRLEELHRPVDRRRRDRLRRVRRRRARACPRSATAGSTPASSRSRRSAGSNDTFVSAGYAAGAGVGLTIADLPDHAYWEKWFPADWVSEMREQIRLWFYSMLFMSVALDGPRAVPARARLREGERRDRPPDAQVVGQRDLVRRRGREDGRRRHALDVRRPDAGAEPELRLRAGRARSSGGC